MMDIVYKEKRAVENPGNYVIELIQYDKDNYVKSTINDIDDYNFSEWIGHKKEEGKISWINIDGEFPSEVLDRIGKEFNLHPYVVEDIIEGRKRAKIENHEEHLYIVAKTVKLENSKIVIEHMSFIVGKSYILTIGDQSGDIFQEIRSRIKTKGTKIRKSGIDYLLYTIFDEIVDGYIDVLESIGEKVDDLEEDIMGEVTQEHLHKIRELKKVLTYIHKFFWPLREVISRLIKEGDDFISRPMEIYFRDIYEHSILVTETIETDRELLAGLTDLYISNTSNRLNEVMKVLTIISTIFIPLTFIAGIYGMNFKYMPELHQKWGYPAVLGIMCVLAFGMLYFFKRKKWF